MSCPILACMETAYNMHSGATPFSQQIASCPGSSLLKIACRGMREQCDTILQRADPLAAPTVPGPRPLLPRWHQASVHVSTQPLNNPDAHIGGDCSTCQSMHLFSGLDMGAALP